MFKDDLLKDKRILVTGGGTGLGKEMVTHFAKHGAQVYICGRRGNVLEDTANELKEKYGVDIKHEPLDIRSPQDVDDYIGRIFEEGPLDGLVNNAAGNFISPTKDLSSRGFDAIANIVFHGTFYVTHSVGKRWIENKCKGSIISILATWVWTGSAYVVPSAMSKTGLDAMTKSLAVEWGPYGIRLNSIAPGPVNTGMLEEVLKAGPTIVGKRFYEKSVQQKNNGGTNINVIISLAEFLITRKDNKINGRLISAIWDNWKVFDKKINIFKNSEFGTLRRISGKDRKLNIFDK